METEINKIEPNDTGGMWKKLISQTLRIVISALVLYGVISLVQWQNVVSAYKSADGRCILIAALLLLFNIGARTLKWRTMLYSVKSTPTYAEAFGSVMLGISLGSFTPGEIGEFAGRALHISGAQRSHLVGLAILDKAQIFIVTSCAGILSLLYLTLHNLFIIAVLAALVLLLSGLFIMRLGMIAQLSPRFYGSFFHRSWLKRVLDGFGLLQLKQIIVTVLYTLIFHLTLILQMFFLINSFSHISFTHAFIGTSAMMFVKSLLPISIGDLGIREAGSIYFFSIYGISQAAALNASLLLFFINIFIPSIVGIYFIRHQRISLNDLLQFWKKTRRQAND